ncbi:hypothetical protein K0040_02365 [Terrisporobacter petrolearius]|nr:hypothetical protein [Terrisporobacter petrolearius]MCC3863158.1 hypothetical protein [Terrisporobacter petrolearius]
MKNTVDCFVEIHVIINTEKIKRVNGRRRRCVHVRSLITKLMNGEII